MVLGNNKTLIPNFGDEWLTLFSYSGGLSFHISDWRPTILTEHICGISDSLQKNARLVS